MIRSFDIPYSNRLAISMLISAEFDTANSAITLNSHGGNPGTPARTTSSSGALEDSSCSVGTT